MYISTPDIEKGGGAFTGFYLYIGDITFEWSLCNIQCIYVHILVLPLTLVAV